MGLIADLNRNDFSTPPDLWGRAGGIHPNAKQGVQLRVGQYLTRIENQFADPVAGAEFLAADEVQNMAVHTGTPSAGTFTLTITLKDEAAFTTAAIAYDATAGTVETAIDTAAGIAGLGGWAAGNISVAGGPLTTTPMTFTYDGAFVDEEKHGLMTAADSITGGTPGAITVTTRGQTYRNTWAFLVMIGAIDSPIPDQGSITPLTGGTGRHTFAPFPNNSVLAALCAEAAMEDNRVPNTGAVTDVPGLLDALLGAVGIDTENRSSYRRNS